MSGQKNFEEWYKKNRESLLFKKLKANLESAYYAGQDSLEHCFFCDSYPCKCDDSLSSLM